MAPSPDCFRNFRFEIPDIGLVNFTSMCRIEANDIGNGKYTSTSMLYYPEVRFVLYIPLDYFRWALLHTYHL